MTAFDVYNQAKSLPVNDRLLVARLILDDLTDKPPSNFETEEELEELLMEAINNGKTVEVNDEFWARKRQELIEIIGPK